MKEVQPNGFKQLLSKMMDRRWMITAFIGSYGKIIDYWFSDTDKDKMLVQKMDEEDDTPEMIKAKQK